MRYRRCTPPLWAGNLWGRTMARLFRVARETFTTAALFAAGWLGSGERTARACEGVWLQASLPADGSGAVATNARVHLFVVAGFAGNSQVRLLDASDVEVPADLTAQQLGQALPDPPYLLTLTPRAPLAPQATYQVRFASESFAQTLSFQTSGFPDVLPPLAVSVVGMDTTDEPATTSCASYPRRDHHVVATTQSDRDAQYQLLRNGVVVDASTVPRLHHWEPRLTDTPNAPACFTVRAVDASGNASAPSAEVCSDKAPRLNPDADVPGGSRTPLKPRTTGTSTDDNGGAGCQSSGVGWQGVVAGGALAWVRLRRARHAQRHPR